MIRQPLRIGTRGSKLALAQAGLVRAEIAAAVGEEDGAELVVITTSGDTIQDRRLMDIGGKGLFTKEIEKALLDGRIDAAVHSLKDMPAEGPAGLILAAIPRREDPCDAFLSTHYETLEALPKGARLATASLRRQAQALHRRPDLAIMPMRGNVDTRLTKLGDGEADGLILAAAGLNRLGLGDWVRSFIDPNQSPPAPGQGALAIQTRIEDVEADWLETLRDLPTMLAVAAERGALTALEGDCRTAMGAHAVVHEGVVRLTIEALSPDGVVRIRREGEAATEDLAAARALGMRLGLEIAAEGRGRI